jgi:dTDP-4-dehydrorhamnose reductase
MRILIVGGTGMLGHKLAQVLGSADEVIVTVRGDAAGWPRAIPVAKVAANVDVREIQQLARLLDQYRPEAVLNAAGVIKHIMGGVDPVETLAVNSVYPNLLARLCATRAIRLVHYSTDCVFSGLESSERGPDGYRESDLPDARDLYGMSKLLGEPSPPCLALRTSIIGRELRAHAGLVDWFLAQRTGPVRGFTHALFTGLPTIELARVTRMLLRNHPILEGLWHLAAPPIDKFALLGLVKASYGQQIEIQPHADFYCDRRLDGSRFREATGWQAPGWPQLIARMREDQLDYEAFQ